MLIRGLFVALAGFSFIFLPGVIVSTLVRRNIRYETNLLLWGMGIMVITLFPSLYLTSLLRLIIFKEHSPGMNELYAFSLLGSFIAAIFLAGGIYLFIHFRRVNPENLLSTGILIGLGIGLLTNIFQGISLVGQGFRLVLGDMSLPGMDLLASQAWLDLLVKLVGLNIYRIALVAYNATLAGFVSLALLQKRLRWFWLAIFLNTVIMWIYTAIGLAWGTESVLANLIALVYEAGLGFLALTWLFRQTSNPPEKTVN